MDIVRTGAAPLSPRAEQYLVPMRDGVRLATDVYLPASGEPTEAVLVRLPYDKNSRYVFFENIAERFTGRGYAVVVQDVRGKFRSEGDTLAFFHEAADGYDTIEWVIAQPWSNGAVGMFGDSYYGFTQWAAVSSGHPALRAIVPRVTSADLAGTWRPSGPVREAEWLTTADYLVNNWTNHDRYEVEFDWSVRPLRAVVDDAAAAIGERSASLDIVLGIDEPVGAGDEDGVEEGGDLVSLLFPDGHPFDRRPLPVLHCIGWFDNLLIPSMRDYTTLDSRPDWAPLQHLWADSIDHENYHLDDMPITAANDHATNDAALQRMLDIYAIPAIDFFDVHLKGLPEAPTIPRVAWHLGHVGYRQSPSWPPPGSTTLRLYLDPAAGGLVAQPPSDPTDASWVHDPHDLVPSAVDNSFSFLHDYPDESAVAERSDVVTFAAEPATEPLDLAGPVVLHVALTSTAPSADLFAKVYDVSPDGAAHMIVRGQGHLRSGAYGHLVEVELGHTGYRVRPSHRLRLQLASSDFPEFVPHPGTTEHRWTAVDTERTTQTLIGASHSYLSLTSIPAADIDE